jgi:hypothetical protein
MLVPPCILSFKRAEQENDSLFMTTPINIAGHKDLQPSSVLGLVDVVLLLGGIKNMSGT